MKLSKGTQFNFEVRIKAVKTYLTSHSLKETAFSFGVHPRTLKRWLKRYQVGGIENLKRKKTYQRHAKRFSVSTERKIVLLKENKPSLTLLEAQNILLTKFGLKISLEGIRAIWKRYDLIGFRKKIKGTVKETNLELKDSIEKAESLLKKGMVKESAQLLNELPSCSGEDILKKIPDRFLSLKRQVEKLPLTFGTIPFSETIQRSRSLRKRATKKGLLNTALRAGIAELFASAWRASPDKLLSLVHGLRSIVGKGKSFRINIDPLIKFNLLFMEAIALADIGKTKKAISFIKKCEVLARYFSYPNFYHKISSLYSIIGFYKNALDWAEKGLNLAKKDEDKSILYQYLSTDFAVAGEYISAMRIFKKIKTSKEIPGSLFITLRIQAQCALGKGRIDEASELANQSLSEAKKEKTSVYLSNASFIQACCLCAIGERKRAINLLKRTFLFLEKFRMRRSVSFIRVLLGKKFFTKDEIFHPLVRLTLLLSRAAKSLKIMDYKRALRYATSHRIIGAFHRIIFFFPEPVNNLIAKGKSTGLPKALLKLPIFQKDIPVYHLYFLGSEQLYRNGVRLREGPTPMYLSLLIHLIFMKRIELNSLYNNFWPKAKNQRNSLSHLLYGLRKYLRVPPHILFIRGGFLNFKGYITTDYQEFEQMLIRAKALARAGEWGFAKREYLRAFKLFRGEPLKKNFDEWSLNMRFKILSQLETEAINFAKSCLEHKNKKDAKKILEKVLKITPDSEEIKKLSDSLIV